MLARVTRPGDFAGHRLNGGYPGARAAPSFTRMIGLHLLVCCGGGRLGVSAVPNGIEPRRARRRTRARRAPGCGARTTCSSAARRSRRGAVRGAGSRTSASGWVALLVFGACAAVAQLFVVVMPRRGQNSEGTLSYHTTAVFLLPVALLLSPPLAALVAVVQHVPEWLRKRSPGTSATFNIFNYTITILATLGVSLADPARGRRIPTGPAYGDRRDRQRAWSSSR